MTYTIPNIQPRTQRSSAHADGIGVVPILVLTLTDFTSANPWEPMQSKVDLTVLCLGS